MTGLERSVRRVAFAPFADQAPGTSGLRKKTEVFRRPHYLASYIQAVLETLPLGRPLVVGGDGRFFSDEALQLILKMAAANGAREVVVGQRGLLSTPAASNLIRKRNAGGGIILSASHNPGGPDGDFGVKVNGANGAPIPERLGQQIHARASRLTEYRRFDAPDLDIATTGRRQLGPLSVEIIDSTADYADLMEKLFDFDVIADLLRRPDFRMVFDGMNAVTGPYAREIFERRLGAADPVIRGEPKPDFGGRAPDPTPEEARELATAMDGRPGLHFGAASDGDGDRHLIMGPGFTVAPSDSLAILTANADAAPGYRGRLVGVARSMPTSRAVDAVARSLKLPCFETPTGWKHFASLLDEGKITFCGEESAGAGSDHVREKDGLWAILFWLNILAVRRQSVAQVVQDHWRRFGRHATTRLDYETLDPAAANALMEGLRKNLRQLAGRSACGRLIEHSDDFEYLDPVTGEVASAQGVRLLLSDGGRVVFRLSGTGTEGATLRIYLEQYVDDPGRSDRPAGTLTAQIETLALAASDLALITGRHAPTHRT